MRGEDKLRAAINPHDTPFFLLDRAYVAVGKDTPRRDSDLHQLALL